EMGARAFTEAPDTLRGLMKQRFRWAFGTLQSLWKHREALLNPRYGTFGLIVLPTLWLFQVVFQVISPAVDVLVLTSLWSGDVTRVLFYYSLFFVAELVAAWLAFTLEREDRRSLIWLFWQRFVYRQVMYGVILWSLKCAIEGAAQGWGKLQRRGTSAIGTVPGE